MYRACQHVKTSGTRCRSRAMRGEHYCYFHLKCHVNPSETEPLHLPIPEEFASIAVSVARINEALLAKRIDVRQSAQLFRGLNIAYQAILHRTRQPDPDSIETVTNSGP